MLGIYTKIYLKLFRRKWRKLNRHNFMVPTGIFNPNLVEVGIGTCGGINVVSYGSINEKLIIGNYCSVADDVKFILGGEHNIDNLTTYPFRILYLKQHCENISKGPIVIGHDVWIGHGAKILSGITIGNGAVIGAFSVVRRDIPPYAIAIGNPIRIVGYRFSREIINALEEINLFDKLSINNILNNINMFEEAPSNDIMDKINKILNPPNDTENHKLNVL